MKEVVSFFTLLITSIFVIQLQQSYADGRSPYESAYDHGCDDADLSPSDGYISEPGKGPSSHNDAFMSGYWDGFKECGGPLGGCDGGCSGSGGGSLEVGINRICIESLGWLEQACDDIINMGRINLICKAAQALDISIPC